MRRLRTAKGRQPDKGRQTQAHVRNSLGFPTCEEIADKRWRLAGGGDVQVDDRSTHRLDGGERSG